MTQNGSSRFFDSLLVRPAVIAAALSMAGMIGLEAQGRAPADCDERGGTAATLGDLLQGRVSGVTVLQSGGGAVGGAKQIRIRGINSVRGNDPIVFVDNIRMTPLSATGPRGAHSIPLFEFVDPTTITRVEVLKGPTATIQYADASGGVIRIYTTRGRGEPGGAAEEPSCRVRTRKP